MPCHSERSEESEQIALREEFIRFFAALRMTVPGKFRKISAFVWPLAPPFVVGDGGNGKKLMLNEKDYP